MRLLVSGSAAVRKNRKMKLELKVNSDEYFMSMILLVLLFVVYCCYVSGFPSTQLYDHEKATGT